MDALNDTDARCGIVTSCWDRGEKVAGSVVINCTYYYYYSRVLCVCVCVCDAMLCNVLCVCVCVCVRVVSLFVRGVFATSFVSEKRRRRKQN